MENEKKKEEDTEGSNMEAKNERKKQKEGEKIDGEHKEERIKKKIELLSNRDHTLH